ncbi:Ohr family peroxiredoxin [Deinococcus maricopensis]|uniref:Peroxiredoxin, Ohr subfamily n=1 Tax=Deinococcus maricopensis (strain DSM 21211 / LMG 22137 / NRRL B-23946 / LB-34) TaxID=709986 RepID=E8U3D0_DEIML|nr:Ohr family peroxiredoxin [Deinococcus maricopensis]ADV65801.1 peroxiredoxin, Ohr subfamily [Deinococcus maricopensis DSM 21211]
MTQELKPLFTATSLVTGGRSGDLQLGRDRTPLTLRPARTRRAGTDPEELFAAGYAACYLSALNEVADARRVRVSGAQALGQVTLNVTDAGEYILSVALHVYLPDVAHDEALDLMRAAHAVCPYSHAVRGNIEVTLVAADAPLS